MSFAQEAERVERRLKALEQGLDEVRDKTIDHSIAVDDRINALTKRIEALEALKP